MTEMKEFYVWYADGSGRRLSAADHFQAARKAAEMALEENGPAPLKSDRAEGLRYDGAVRVYQTHCLDDGTRESHSLRVY